MRHGGGGGGGGGMEFPSAETALMTISFLTLAVFLIKLVLVCIYSTESVQKMKNYLKKKKIIKFFIICSKSYIR